MFRASAFYISICWVHSLMFWDYTQKVWNEATKFIIIVALDISAVGK